MATQKKEEVKAPAIPWENQKVRVTLFKDNGKYKDDETVAVNGKVFRIQRGKEVEIPMYVWQVLKQSMAQDVETANMIQQLTDDYKAKEKNFNF